MQGDIAAAQVSAADLANATLSAQATLASDYVDLRAADSDISLLRQTVAAYQRSLQITENQYNAGVAAASDVITARTQLEGAQAQLISAGEARAQYEHAIAVLTGHAPIDLTLPPGRLMTNIPVVPAGLPSTLLQRRPDIAAAERTMAEQNTQIGVAEAAFYPTISLSRPWRLFRRSDQRAVLARQFAVVAWDRCQRDAVPGGHPHRDGESGRIRL